MADAPMPIPLPAVNTLVTDLKFVYHDLPLVLTDGKFKIHLLIYLNRYIDAYQITC
jgi:hypothetical protein